MGAALGSQHIGEMENARTHTEYRRSLDLYLKTNEVVPEIVAVDKHPSYFSTVFGQVVTASRGIPVVSV